MKDLISLLVFILIIFGALSGCTTGTVSPSPSPTLGAEEGAREWIDAIVNQDGNKILKYTCKAQRDNVKQSQIWTSAFSVLAQVFTTQSSQIEDDISDLKFETINQDSDRTEVRVYGELRLAVLGNAEAYDVDEQWQIVRENETWRWCGSSIYDAHISSSESSRNMQPLLADGQIAFSSTHDGTWNIYVINSDGSGLMRLTDEHGIGPAWSPDYQHIAFSSSSDSSGDLDIYVMNADGSNETRLTDNPATDVNPTWSSDGRQIAFRSNRDDDDPQNCGNSCQWSVYVMNTDGGGLMRLTERGGGRLTWSPRNRKQIAFNDSNAVSYLIDSDGNNLKHLTDNGSKLVWSLSVDQIAFASNRDGNHEIYVMNNDGSGQTNLTKNSATDLQPSWSPDGTKIAFYSNRGGNNDWKIYTMNVDGTSLIPLTDQPAYVYPLAWAPSGEKIAFNGADNNIYVINVDGTELRRLTNTGKASGPDWLSQ